MHTYVYTGNFPAKVSADSSGLNEAPTNLTATTLSSTGIRVTWGPPEFTNDSQFFTYNVSYDAPHEICNLTNDTTIELVGLEEGTKYFITVEAVYNGITCGFAQTNATTLIGK